MENQFLKYREKVNTCLDAYDSVHNQLEKSLKGKSASIKALAHPFKKGHFTLAIIGKMSAGKSSFINALLKRPNLLATGYGQTTCMLTEIVHNETEGYKVFFADGHEESVSRTELQEYMKVPDKYSDLPVKQINKYIIEGETTDQIWVRKQELQEIAARGDKDFSKKLLEEYVSTHPKAVIPDRICISVPLSEDLHGWKIIDTPGIDAVGGLEDETFELLNGKDKNGNNKVDAIIFINSTENRIEDKTFCNFVKETIDGFTDDIKRRTFMIRTHGADRRYLRSKESEEEACKKLFVNGLNLPESSIFVVDSLCYILLKYTEDVSLDLTNIISNMPEDWQEYWDKNECKNAWYEVGDLIEYAEKQLNSKKQSKNQETLKETISSWANFEKLIEKLNDFVKTEKERAYQELLKKIKDDFNAWKQLLKKKLSPLEENLDEVELKRWLEQEKANLDKAKQEMNTKFPDFQRKFGRNGINQYFSKVQEQVGSLSGGLNDMRNLMRRYLSEADDCKKQILDDVSKSLDETLKDALKKFDVEVFTIDFDNIARMAKEDATHTVIVGYEKMITKEEGPIGMLKRLLSFMKPNSGNLRWGYKEVDDTSRPICRTKIDETEAAKKFRTAAIKIFTESLDQFKKAIGTEIDNIGKEVKIELDRQIEKAKTSYKQACTVYKEKEEETRQRIEDLKEKIQTIDHAITIING